MSQVHRYSRRLWAALLAEFLGLAIFQIYGGSANDDVAALANGITLAVIGSFLSSAHSRRSPMLDIAADIYMTLR